MTIPFDRTHLSQELDLTASRHAQMGSTPWLDRAAIERTQLVQLNAAIASAFANTSFHASRLSMTPLRSLEELAAIPLMTRADIAEHGAAMLSRQYDKGALVAVRTAGTTASPLTLFTTTAAVAQHRAFVDRARAWLSAPSAARVVAIAGGDGRVFPTGEPGEESGDHIATLKIAAAAVDVSTVTTFAAAIAAYAPDLIEGYPTAIAAIARHAISHERVLARPALIITYGEPLTGTLRRSIELAFKCPVFDLYVAAEMVALISQCRAGAYHVASDYGMVEVMHGERPALPGETGEIVATGFVNDAMPLIRYATGDIVVLGQPHCACGRSFPTVTRIIGRVDDAIVAPDGRIVVEVDLPLRPGSTVLETRIVQDAPDHVTLEVECEGSLDALEAASLIATLRQRLGPAFRADVVRMAHLSSAGDGRRRVVEPLLSPPSAWPRARMRTPAPV